MCYEPSCRIDLSGAAIAAAAGAPTRSGRSARVPSLGIFDPFLRREQRPDSDLDLLVEFREPPSLLGFIRLENELGEKWGVNVDLADAVHPV